MSIFSLIKKYNIRPQKRLGQNFLIAKPTIEKIVRLLEISHDDKVLEVGPGLGVMTMMLAEKAIFVAAVESDKEMIAILENEYGKMPNLHIIHGNILGTNLDKLLGRSSPWLFVGNIPYNITSPLLFHIRRFRSRFKYGVLTIQKEVADRLTARPKTKEYGILTIAIQSVGTVEKCFNISPSSFFPEPKVESTVIKISFEEKPLYEISDLDFFTTVVRAAFSTRRKKLKNALIQSQLLDIPAEKIIDAIRATGVHENSRAEELDISTFAGLARALK